MKIIEITKQVNKQKYRVQFVCSSRNTRNGFAHDATLIINGASRMEATCHYLNRTWEYWAYQSVCIQAVHNLKEKIETRTKDDYKYFNGIKRLTPAHKKAIEKELADDPELKLLKAVRKELDKLH